jgi:3-vinyl bacteriochlorophyllide hydratase
MLSMRGARTPSPRGAGGAELPPPLYTDAERARRDASRWTLVQGVLAPLQFSVMVVSVGLVLRFLATGEGLAWATASVVTKTVLLYAIMVTGSIWEKEVFGRWLFAPAFFWEDVLSMAVIALHTAYLLALATGVPGPRGQMVIALVAYAVYAVNALQFLAKLRAARRDEARRVRMAAHLAHTAGEAA